MDPLSQAALGAALPQSVSKPERIVHATWIGALAGMAPDLDVLIRSSTDPILFLEYHRQFTHSLIFIPVGALLCSVVFWGLARRVLSFSEIFVVALLGYGTHALLDACTTYGTLLLWPFSDARIAWNTVSVIDPLFTLPLLLFVVLAILKRQPKLARVGLCWALIYLGFGWVQSERAETAGHALAASRGHSPVTLQAKPGFANLFLWKIVYEFDGKFYVDAIRAGINIKVFPGNSIVKLDTKQHLPWLDQSSQQAKDLARFDWFSNRYLAIDRDNPLLIVDVRYSMLPNEIKGLWGIELDPDAPADAHVNYVVQRNPSAERLDQLLTMLFD